MPGIPTEIVSLPSLRWRHNEHDGVSNHQPHDCILKRFCRRRSNKTSKPRVTGLCAGNSPGTSEFPAHMASYAESVSIWWCHHVGVILASHITNSDYHKTSSINRTKSQTLYNSFSPCLAAHVLCLIPRSQVLSRERRCSWSSADMRCPDYIWFWVINECIAYKAAPYIRFTLVAYGSGKRMVTGSRAGSRIQTKNFKRRFLARHMSQRRDIWCTNSPVIACFNPKFVDRSVPYEAKQRRVKFRRSFGNILSEFR